MLLSCFLSINAFSQSQPPPQADKDVPKAKITETGKASDGSVVFAVRLFASSSKGLDLRRVPMPIAKGQFRRDGDKDSLPFSLGGSTLVDIYTQKTYPCLSILPSVPFFGPMAVRTRVNPGAWIQLGVAFPPLPPPPTQDGKQLPYHLLLRIPELKMETEVTLDPKTFALLSSQP